MLLRAIFLLWAVTHASVAFAQDKQATALKPDLVVIGSIVSDQTEHLPSAVPPDAKGEAEIQRQILVRKLVIRVHRVVEGSVKSDLIEAQSVRTILSTSKTVPDQEFRALLRELGLPLPALPDRSGSPKKPLLRAWRFDLARISDDPNCSADAPAMFRLPDPGQLLGSEAIPCYRLLRGGMQPVKGVFAAPEKAITGMVPARPDQSKDQAKESLGKLRIVGRAVTWLGGGGRFSSDEQVSYDSFLVRVTDGIEGIEAGNLIRISILEPREDWVREKREGTTSWYPPPGWKPRRLPGSLVLGTELWQFDLIPANPNRFCRPSMNMEDLPCFLVKHDGFHPHIVRRRFRV